MNKLKMFISNFFVYGASSIVSKIIPLLFYPVIVNMFPSSKYIGINDLFNTLQSFSVAIAMMGIYDAMFRMFFEQNDNDYKKTVCSTSLFFVLANSFFVIIMMYIFRNRISILFLKDQSLNKIVVLACFATLSSSINSIVSLPTRMQNQKKIYFYVNLITPIISYTISIPLIINGYYFIALPVSLIISNIVIDIFFYIRNRKWFSINYFNINMLKELLLLSIPLFPSFLLYWVINSCDRLMIIQTLNVEASGVFAVASKFGSISNLIYMAFAGGWQFFAFSTMNDTNQVETNSKIFEYLGVISFLSFCTMCVFSKTIFSLFFPSEYLYGAFSAPCLFLAPLLQMLFQVESNQFLIIKKTLPSTCILCTGAIVNVILNNYLIPNYGIEGASIASLISYIVINIVCYFALSAKKLIKISTKFLLCALITLLFYVSWRTILFDHLLIGFFFMILVYIIFVIIYHKDAKRLFNKLKSN